jgi:glioma pathogenesis-related protein 2
VVRTRNHLHAFHAQEVVDHWYSEHSKYNFESEPHDVQGIGNFTQVVWKGTKEIGVGKAIQTEANGATRVVVVCHYFPAGNVLTKFMDNVQKTK